MKSVHAANPHSLRGHKVGCVAPKATHAFSVLQRIGMFPKQQKPRARLRHTPYPAARGRLKTTKRRFQTACRRAGAVIPPNSPIWPAARFDQTRFQTASEAV
ncbi:hypothetical protein [Kingella potus]|uniref:hypothetical protein n=1 Tax=Kingella potus TaxID=265175 RepID=UPI001FD0AB7F|nr:hypothetical protein [Kingella potus]UOP00854.1 hypothetical protein LVJ84_14145 [Kingella potus]